MTLPHAAELNLRADADAIATAVAAVLACCQDWALPEEALFQVELGLTEALNNIVQHACSGLDQPIISIVLDYDGQSLNVHLRDPGNAMSAIPDRNLPDVLEEGGRGWFIIYACFDKVVYTRHADENHLLLHKRLPDNRR